MSRICPMCGKNGMETLTIKEYHTKMGGVPIVVKNAKIEKCKYCEEQMYSAKEIRRWEKIKEEQI